MNEPGDNCSLRSRRSATQQTATIVSVRQEDGQFIACCRDDAGEQQEATGTGSEGSQAIINAAMKLFEAQPFAKFAENGYMIETENHAYAWYKYDDEGIVDHPEWVTTEVGPTVSSVTSN